MPPIFGQLGLGQHKPGEKPNKPKKTILNGLTQDSSHRIGFLVFLEFLGSWAWDSKILEKNQIIKPKNNKKILNGLAQDSSHRIDFFYLDINLGILAMKKNIVEKQAKKQHMQKPNAPSVPFCFTMDGSMHLLSMFLILQGTCCCFKIHIVIFLATTIRFRKGGWCSDFVVGTRDKKNII